MNKIILLIIALLFTFGLSAQVTQNEGFYYQNGKFFSGVFEQLDDTGKLIARISIKNGLPDGISEYYKNEALIDKREYRNGLKHGVWTKYDNGIKISEAGYRKDKKHGRWLVWDENQVLRYEMFYKKGKKSGTWKMWDENGKLISEKIY